MIRQIFAVLPLLLLSGCSVFMAANSEREPDLSVLQVGTSRVEVERVFGPPITPVKPQPAGLLTYQYFVDDTGSVQRAVVYSVLDVATLGLAELVTTPVEALQGDKHIVEVRYDRQGRVRAHRIYVEKAPLERPEKMLGIEKKQEI